MATTSLGRLTLDLAVRLSEFSDGLTRAERETRDRTQEMGDSVRNFRDRMMEDLGGTPIGGVIDSLNQRLGALSGGGLAATGALAGMAVGGAAVAAGALVALTLESAKADVQLAVMAATANTGLKSFQVLTHAAAGLGVEQDALAGILADTQEKLGEFSATGGGGAADFFEALQNNTKMTDEEIRNLGKTLQGKDGVEAIQILKNKMDDLGATSQEQRFMFESLAGDLGNLMPLFADGGDILNKYGEELEAAGVIKTDEAIEQSRRLTAQTQAVSTQFEGFKTQLAVQMMPVLNNLIGYFVSGKTKGGDFGNAMDAVGIIAKTVGAGIIGVAGGVKLLVRMIQAFGEQIANVGITSTNFFEADGFMAKARALKQGAVDVYNINARLGADFVSEMVTIKNAMTGMYTPATAALTGLAGANYELSKSMDANSKGLAVNTVEADENAKAQEKRAAALAKAQKVAGEVKLKPNAKALANAENYGFANYEAQYGLPYGLMTGIHMQESHGKTNATGPATKWGTAKGGFQLIDATAKRFQVDNAYNMEQATEGAAKYLSYLYKHFNGDLAKTIAAYNTGEGNVDNNPMSLILSDRWARNKKTGIGQTKEYTKNVLAYMKSATTDTSKLVYDTVSKQAQDAQKLQEETLRRQSSIVAKYATDREKIESDHTNNVAEIQSLYSKGSVDYIKYMAREEERYATEKNASLLSIAEKYMSEEQQIHDKHQKALKQIEAANIEDDTTRQMFIDVQNAMYQKDLDNFRFAAQAKAREQDKYYQSIAQSMKANRLGAASTGLDSMAQRTMSGQDYEAWRLAQDHDEAFNSVNGQYAGRQNEINARDERGDFLLPELERNELLETARQEHLDAMWSMEQEFSLKQQQLDEAQKSARIEMYQGLFGGLAGLTKSFFGEQSAAHKVFFGIEKGFAIAQSAIAIQQAVAKAMALGFPQNIPFIGAAVAQGASIMSNLQSVSVDGIAHGGLDYVPKESTYLLDKGERVLSPNQNSDLTKFMQGDNSSGLTINNYSSAKVEASSDGKTITITDVRNEVKRGFTELQNPNSHNAKMVKSSFNTTVRR